MLRFRACTSAISTLRRLFATTAPAISTNQGFSVHDYLIDTCGLTRYQAMRASMKLSHLKSPAKPDVVLAFLAGLGLSNANVAAAIAKVPRLLYAGVDRTLAPIVAGLTGIGLSHPAIARLFHIAPKRFRCRSTVSKLTWPKDMLRRRSEFLILEVGLKPLDIAHWPAIIFLSLEGRLRSRHYVLKFLKENGFVDRDWSFSSAVTKADDVFMES